MKNVNKFKQRFKSIFLILNKKKKQLLDYAIKEGFLNWKKLPELHKKFKRKLN